MKHAHHRLLSRERRQRADALHRAYDRRPERSLDSLLNQCSSIGSTSGDTAQPFTVGKAVQEELHRHRGNDLSPSFEVRAGMLARSVEDREPNPQVRAEWAVEKALVEMAHGLPFNHFSPDFFLDGQSYYSRWDSIKGRRDLHKSEFTGLHSDDLERLRTMPSPKVLDGVLTATWKPTHPCRLWDSDPIRPPVEALALVARQATNRLDDFGDDGTEALLGIRELQNLSIVCIGLGFSGAVQALSVMMQDSSIHHVPVPYYLPDHVELAHLSELKWDVVILGLPCCHGWQVASVLAGAPDMSFIQRRGVIEGRLALGNPVGHVPALLNLAQMFRQPGTVLAILAEPEPFHTAVHHLGSAIEPMPGDQYGTDKRAVWVDYQTRQWAPHHLPQPTGRLVAFRRWR